MKILSGPLAGHTLRLDRTWLRPGEQVGIQAQGVLQETFDWKGSENYIVTEAGLLHAPIPEKVTRKWRGRVRSGPNHSEAKS